MEIQYSLYTLRPKVRANRLSSLEPKTGVYLRSLVKNEFGYADYFPHAELGDSPTDKFLAGLKDQINEYDKKIVEFIKKDPGFRKQICRPFLNHQLWTGIETLKSPVIKYKMLKKDSELYLDLLNKGIRIRFDGNALLSRDELKNFIDRIPTYQRHLVEYMEDPIKSLDWSDLPVPTAQDFIKGDPCSFYIHKPNARFYPDVKVPVIFSGYMGSELGLWHAYSELLEKGDLNQVHGLIVEDFYEDQQNIFLGDYHSTFIPDEVEINNIYRDLGNREWKTLCSI